MNAGSAIESGVAGGFSERRHQRGVDTGAANGSDVPVHGALASGRPAPMERHSAARSRPSHRPLPAALSPHCAAHQSTTST